MTVAYGYGLIYDDFPLCALLIEPTKTGYLTVTKSL